MAVATATVTVTKAFKTGRIIKAFGTIALSGGTDTYPTGGLPISFAGKIPGTNRAPLRCKVDGKAGFVYTVDLGTDITNSKLMVWTNTAGGVNGALTEHSAVDMVAGVDADTIRFDADFDALI